MKAVLNPGSGFGHEAGGVDAAVSQASTIRKMSLEFLSVSSVEGRERHYRFMIGEKR